MKNVLATLLSASLLILLTNFSNPRPEKFKVDILQNGELVSVIDNTVTLYKKEFQIRITLIDQDGVFMNALFGREYFDLKDSDSIRDYKYLNLKASAESTFNEEKELLMDEDGFSYFFYHKKMDWHRFDKDIKVDGKTVTGTKTVTHLFVDALKETVALKNVEQDIYLFFLATGEWKKGKVPEEYGRYKLQIKWKEVP